VALQITNILRDIVEDRDTMGRVYLPLEDRERFGVDADVRGPTEALMAVITYEAGRAEEWFGRGLELLPMLDWRSRACTAAMAGIYRRLLQRIQRDPAGVLRDRMSLSGVEKAAVALRALVKGTA
jgi:phytoene synthase